MADREFHRGLRSEARSYAQKEIEHMIETMEFMGKQRMREYVNLEQIESAFEDLRLMRESIISLEAVSLTEFQKRIVDVLEGKIKVEEDRLLARQSEVLEGRSEARMIERTA